MNQTGYFTLPGEAGYEDLTLELARRWGADVIRDSDGTALSEDILASGYDIYSTLCLVRADNAWAKTHPDKLQQAYVMSYPVLAEGDTVRIDLLKGYFREQLRVNTTDDPKTWWQVFDRTSGEEIPAAQWDLDADTGIVTISSAIKWHKYTVNFLAYRIWEEISMYNHVTNDWGDREHLMPIEPMFPEVQERILSYLEQWLKDHPHTKVVRFTSMFYNFFWFWGDDPNLRFILNDWGSYEFSVNPFAMTLFQKVKGYRLTSEDFVNKGLYNSSHLPPSPKYRDWIDFINEFVVSFSKQCIDLVHASGKKAYVFYNDHWIGLEPYGERFKNCGFDGIIDGIFNGFEARKVAGTKHVEVRELRLHPYLFPTGVNDAQTFMEGGNPTLECKTYWLDIRRALLRDCVDRIGFGGYLHLVKGHPEFVEYVEALTREFRILRAILAEDTPYTSSFKVAILTAWGNLRAWACCGHFNRGNYYNEVMESISGLPVKTIFISFEDLLTTGIPADVKVIINAGHLDDAWSGGVYWKNPNVIEILTEWIANGGGFIGVGEPSAAKHSSQYFQMNHVLGVDRELGLTRNHSRYAYKKPEGSHFITEDLQSPLNFGNDIDNIFVTGGDTEVLTEHGNSPRIAVHGFGHGRSVYCSGHVYTPENARILHRAIYWAAARESEFGAWLCSNVKTECAYYANSKTLVVINNTGQPQTISVATPDGKRIEVSLEAYGSRILKNIS
jgi:beta-D-galactosyl-(1->4)-L-rhamnose phosphorylase